MTMDHSATGDITAQPSVVEQPNEAKAAPATLRMTIEIIRAGTGKREVYELVGTESTSPAEGKSWQ